MQEELLKIKDGGIIKPIRHSSWVSNLVPVRKKNGDIRLCVDFRNLNLASCWCFIWFKTIEHMKAQYQGDKAHTT